MKTDKIEILRFYIHCMVKNGVLHVMKEIPASWYQDSTANAIEPVDDLELIEIHEIMNMPVIKLVSTNKSTKIGQPLMLLKILCCSCNNGSLFVYMLSEKDCQTYYVRF